MRLKLVPIKNAIIFALNDTDGNTGIGEPMLYRWAKRAEGYIGLPRMHRRLKVIDPLTSNLIDPPEDAISIKYIYNGDVTNEVYKDLDESDSVLSGDESSLSGIEGYVWTPLSGNELPEDVWDMQGGQILFDTDRVGNTITIDYTAFPKNNRDQILVPENHLEAISYYVQYRMARAMRWKMMRDPKMMRSGEIVTVREMKKEWLEMKAEAIAETNELTPYDKIRIDLYRAEMSGSFIYNFDD